MDGTTRTDVGNATGASPILEESLETERDGWAAQRDLPSSELVVEKRPTGVVYTGRRTREAWEVA